MSRSAKSPKGALGAIIDTHGLSDVHLESETHGPSYRFVIESQATVDDSAKSHRSRFCPVIIVKEGMSHSFITEIYIEPLQGYYSEALPTLARLKRRVLRLE